VALDHAQYENDVITFFNSLPYEQFETSHCIFCGPEREYAYLFFKGTMSVVRCKCGFVYNRRQPKQEVLDKFYGESDAMSAWARLKTTERERIRQHEKFGKAVEFLSRAGVRSVLDVGCGTGKFLSMLKAKDRTLSLKGIDSNPAAVQVAQGLKLWVDKLSIEEFLEQDKSFYDAITLWGVFEHVKDPIGLLRKLATRIRGDGYFAVCVPNVDSFVVKTLWSKCFTFCPQHLWYFNYQSLEAAFRMAGFEIVFHYTIESEAKPILKHNYGFHPYTEMPDWADNQYLTTSAVLSHDQTILQNDMGYKIVAIARKQQLNFGGLTPAS
jgi:SAM-dependent methyltransferase